MNRRITKVALVAAAAMTLSLASPVTAQASDSAAGKRAPAQTSVTSAPSGATRSPAAAATGSVRFTSHAVLGSSKTVTTRTLARVAVPGAASWSVYADIYVRGVVRVRDTLVASSSFPSGYASWPRSAGYGKVQLRNVRVRSSDASYNQTESRLADSNVALIRRGTTHKITTRIQRKGSKVTVKASKWRVYQPNGSTIPVRKLTLKRYHKGKWRNVKTIKLNKKGAGKVTFKQKKKFKYRVYLKTTSTVKGTYMYFPGKW